MIKAVRPFITRLWDSAGLPDNPGALHESIRFRLLLNDLLVSLISYDRGQWVFEYSDQNKDLVTPHVLPDFPDINKRYVSNLPWPSLLTRVPSTKRPDFAAIYGSEPDESLTLPKLLSRFGRTSYTSPYILEVDGPR
jgi:hypothetical protein